MSEIRGSAHARSGEMYEPRIYAGVRTLLKIITCDFVSRLKKSNFISFIFLKIDRINVSARLNGQIYYIAILFVRLNPALFFDK